MSIQIEAIETSSTRRVGGFTGEDSDHREARMRAYWQDAKNAYLIRCGKLLEALSGNKTLAQYIAEGESVTFPSSIKVDGTTFPVAALTVGLGNIKTWGCPACGSAHGSGVFPSPEVSAKLLSQTQWYYNPTTKALFTISSTCLDVYVVGLGARGHLIDVLDYKALRSAAAPKADAKPAPKADLKAEALAAKPEVTK